ncbi:Copia protein, partial [Mucuna pruriens]
MLCWYPNAEGANFKVWKETVAIVLGCMDLDLALRVEKFILTLDNLQEIKIEKWKLSNRMCLMIMKRFEALFLRVKGRENIREYIMEMSNLVEKLKSLKLELSEDLIVHLVLISLPTHFGECGIVLQYTMSGKPSMNGVTERRNRTLKDISLWGEALKTVVYILNRVQTKAVNKTLYELWTGKEPSINHLHIWGCPIEARPYRQHERKLDSRIVENIRNVVFEEESVNDIGQVLVSITVQETTPIIGDNVQTIVLDIVPE